MKWPAAGLKTARMCFTGDVSGLQPSLPLVIVETVCKQIEKGLEQVDKGIPLMDWHSAPHGLGPSALSPAPQQLLEAGSCPGGVCGLRRVAEFTSCCLSCIINCHTTVDLEGLVGTWMVWQYLGQMRFYLSHSQSCLLSVSAVQIPSSCSSGLAILPWVCRHVLTRWHLLGKCFIWMSQKNCKLTLEAAVFKQMF